MMGGEEKAEVAVARVYLRPIQTNIANAKCCLRSTTMDLTPAGLFEDYHQDFDHLIQSIRTKLEIEVKEQQGGQWLP